MLIFNLSRTIVDQKLKVGWVTSNILFLQLQNLFTLQFKKFIPFPFKFYINEVILGNNTIVCELDDLHLSIITYKALNYLITKDVRFGKKLLHGFNTLVSRATLISGIGERERNKFFKLQREKILQLKK